MYNSNAKYVKDFKRETRVALVILIYFYENNFIIIRARLIMFPLKLPVVLFLNSFCYTPLVYLFC